MEAANHAQRLIGQPVLHNSFGKGVIENLSGNVLTVNFPQGDKKFIYPDAFRNFLKLEDEEGREEFNRLMELRKKRNEVKKEIAREKEETKRKFRSQKILPNSQAVFNLSETELEETLSQGWVFTGKYQSGFSEGRARTAGRVKPNSLCLLTSLEKGQKEPERSLRALSMTDENFYGDECNDGHIPAHRKFRIELSPEESIKIWDAVEETDVPKRFGGLHFRYVSEDSGLGILEMLKTKCSGEKLELLNEMTAYYCRLNQLKSE